MSASVCALDGLIRAQSLTPTRRQARPAYAPLMGACMPSNAPVNPSRAPRGTCDRYPMDGRMRVTLILCANATRRESDPRGVRNFRRESQTRPYNYSGQPCAEARGDEGTQSGCKGSAEPARVRWRPLAALKCPSMSPTCPSPGTLRAIQCKNARFPVAKDLRECEPAKGSEARCT